MVVSNRLPFVLRREDGGWSASPSPGGLVTALVPVLREQSGLWIGWPGLPDEESPEGPELERLLGEASDAAGHDLAAVPLSAEELRDYYEGFANSVLWPLFHDFISRCDFRLPWFDAYVAINRRFAEAVATRTDPSDYVWVHDYQLLYVARALQEAGVHRRTGFFLHTPFPPPDIYLKLPWRRQLLEAMLDYDLVGFQTSRDRRNFVDCVQALDPASRVIGRGTVRRLLTRRRSIRVGTFPIGIDFRDFAEAAAREDVAREAWVVHANLPERKLALGVDRLDYTKGIPHRLSAFAEALERYPELHQRITLVQVVVPSRTAVGEYASLKREIERQVGEINGRFTQGGWLPIHYVYRSLDPVELLAHYRTAEIALVTPLKDGMNLVAKEYCACSVEDEGVLILSEFAGAAAQLRHDALLVNPWDLCGTAAAIHRAFHLPAEERHARMRSLRAAIRRQDIAWWLRGFLGAAGGAPADEEQERERNRDREQERDDAHPGLPESAARP